MMIAGIIGLVLLLLGAKALSKGPVTETTVNNVVAHALIAERDTAVLRKLQVALSMAGRFPQAMACMKRAAALDYAAAKEGAELRERSEQFVPAQQTAVAVVAQKATRIGQYR